MQNELCLIYQGTDMGTDKEHGDTKDVQVNEDLRTVPRQTVRPISQEKLATLVAFLRLLDSWDLR